MNNIVFKDELYHHGVLGQKWGIRRYQNEDGSLTSDGKERYSKEQYKRDKDIYGNSGAKRIQKNVIARGDSVSGARSKEASRINNTREAAKYAGQIGDVVGKIGGAIGGWYASKYLTGYLETKIEALTDPTVNMAVRGIISAGASNVASQLGRDGARSITMILRGYSPNKYR